MTRALIVVDVQPTFCEGGELPIVGGNAVAERVAAYVPAHRKEYALVATTQDWHIDPGTHFSDQPDFVDTWPKHGVAGTANAQLHPALADLAPDASVKKGQYAAAYSGFEGVDDAGVGLDQLLKHCVRDTALDAASKGYQVRVLTNLTEPVSPELGEAAKAKLVEAGVELAEAE